MQPRFVGMTPTEEELRDPWLAQLFRKNPKAVPQLLLRPPAPRSSSATNSEWQEFKEEIRGQVEAINNSLRVLRKDQKKSNKLLRRVYRMVAASMTQQAQEKPYPATPVTATSPMDVPTTSPGPLHTGDDDMATTLHDELFFETDIGSVADVGVQAAMEFLTGHVEIQQHVDDQSNKV